MTSGVVYYNMGNKCLVRLAVSIYSLKKHYTGPITILSEGEESDKFCEKIAKDLGVNFQKVSFSVPEGPQLTFMKKTLLHTVTPYDISVFLDSDTLVTGRINELFEWANEYDFVATNFANWSTTGSTMSKRIRNWEKHYPKLIPGALSFGPALNAGCYAFKKTAAFLKVWYNMTLPGRDINLPEETSMQVILPNYPHLVAPQEFNCSCKHSNPHHPDVRIIHYHRNKHCRDGLPYGADIWVRYYERCLELDIGGMKEWHTTFDRTLRIYNINKKKKQVEKPKEKPVVKAVSKSKYRREDITIVSAISPNLMYAFEMNFPTWQAKPQLAGLPIIIFHHGFDNPEKQLKFVTDVPNAKLVHWDMPKYANIRELMISSFILGTAKHVETDYWLKLDADAYFSGVEDVLEPWHFEKDLCGHRWGVSRGEMLLAADAWAQHIGLPGESFLKGAQIQFAMENVKFKHERIISWICLHRSSFVREVAEICGERLPIPSHDTLLWYMAHRLGKPWTRTMLNRGTGHGKRMHQFLDARKSLAEQGFRIPEVVHG